MRTEPALIIGAIATALIAAVRSFAGDGIITEESGTSIVNLIGVLTPIVVGAVVRYFVYAPRTVERLTGKTAEELPGPP